MTPEELRALVLDAVTDLRKKISIATPGYMCGDVTIELHSEVVRHLAGTFDWRERQALGDAGVAEMVDHDRGVTIRVAPGLPGEHRSDLERISAQLVSAAFDGVYRWLAADGMCDAPGSSEHRRVKGEWYAAGKPDIEPFIRKRANVGPR